MKTKKVKPKSSTFGVADIPQKVRAEFKSWCILRNLSIKVALKVLMECVVKGDFVSTSFPPKEKDEK